MIRFDGNNILIADEDRCFAKRITEVLVNHGARCFHARNMEEAKELLETYEFDLVICNYYLPEGMIHQLVDWCAVNLKTLPLFTCVGYPFPDEPAISQKHLIAGLFSKTDCQSLVTGIGRLLFDFQQFYENLVKIISPEEILIEVQIGERCFFAKPLEVSEERVILQIEDKILEGSFGILKFAFDNENEKHLFYIPGYVDSVNSYEHVFQIHRSYLMNWNRFLTFLNTKQVKITDFLQKAAGI